MRSHYVTGEQLLTHTRAHPAALRRPAWNFVWWSLAAGILSGVFTSGALPEVLRSTASALTTIGGGLILLGLFLTVLRPIWQWLVSRYEITTHRVAQKLGAMAVKRHWVALHSLVSLRVEQSRSQRRRGSGNLHLMNSRGQTWVLYDVPNILEFQTMVDKQRYSSVHRYASDAL